jgi:hypothetical protein
MHLVKNYSKDIAEDYFNSNHFNFILACELLIRTFYKAKLHKEQSGAQKVLYIYIYIYTHTHTHT